MADVKISQLVRAETVTDNDIMPIVNEGATKKVTVGTISDKIIENIETPEFKLILPKMYYAGTCAIYVARGKNYMIDCGAVESYADVKNCLQNFGITHIDSFFITHFHKDHVGNVENLIADNYLDGITEYYLPVSPEWQNMIDADNYFATVQARETQIINELMELNADIYTISQNAYKVDYDDGILLTFFNADNSTYTAYYNDVVNNADMSNYLHTNYNNFSMLVEIDNNGHKTLFTGDIEYIAQETIAEYVTAVDIAIVPHHDSDVRCSETFVSKVNAKITAQTGSQEVSPKAYGHTAIKLGSAYTTENSYTTHRSISVENGLAKNDCLFYMNNIDFALPKNVITANADLNTFTTEGEYYTASGITETLSNAPITATAFRLEVKRINRNDGGRCRQDIFTRDGVHYSRNKTTINDASTWSGWKLEADTVRSISAGNRVQLTTTHTQSGSLYLYGINGVIFVNFRNLRFAESIGVNTPFATIPEAYRPRFSRYIPFVTASKTGTICIQTNGEISFGHLSQNVTTSDYLYLDVPYYTDITDYSIT